MKPEGPSFGCGLLAGVALSGALFVVAAGLGLVVYFGVHRRSPEIPPPPSVAAIPSQGDDAVTEALKPILREYDMPALAAAIVTSEGIQHIGVVGFRKRGANVPATLHDSWHLGSDTKAMTATLIARLVERGVLAWNTPLEEVFPELADAFHPAMRPVTLEQLLTHRSGLPANLDLRRYGGQEVRDLRRQAVRQYLAQPPSHPPGSTMEYSNLGYIVAGAVVEEVLARTWEEALSEQVFGPLQMESAGFGGTGTPGEIDQPWPHTRNGRPAPRNGPDMDNPPVMGPAGRVHCTIQDWARFIQDQLRGARGEPDTLLQPHAYARLQTPPPGGEYAFGWGVTERDWGGGTVLQHSGDNTMNHANVWIAPRRDFAVLACVNQGGDRAFRATDDAVGALIQLLERAAQDP